MSTNWPKIHKVLYLTAYIAFVPIPFPQLFTFICKCRLLSGFGKTMDL